MKSVCLFLCSVVLTAFWAVIEATSRTTSDPFVPEIAGILYIVVGVFCGAMKTRYIKAVLLTKWLTCFSVMLYLWCFHIAEETPHNLFLVWLSQIPTSPMLPWGLRGANLFFSPGVPRRRCLLPESCQLFLSFLCFPVVFWQGGTAYHAGINRCKRTFSAAMNEMKIDQIERKSLRIRGFGDFCGSDAITERCQRRSCSKPARPSW